METPVAIEGQSVGGNMMNAMQVSISNSQTLLTVADTFVRETIIHTLQAESVLTAEVSVALVDDAAIHVVNREHLQHDYPTDVISFLYDSDETGKTLDGELVVSVETAVREAAKYGWQPLDELRLYLVHGLLHLCGYDDLSKKEQRQMRDREESILQNWNLTPHYYE